MQSKLGWTALLLACTHDFMYGLQGFALMFRGEYDFMADGMKIVKVSSPSRPWSMACVFNARGLKSGTYHPLAGLPDIPRPANLAEDTTASALRVASLG